MLVIIEVCHVLIFEPISCEDSLMIKNIIKGPLFMAMVTIGISFYNADTQIIDAVKSIYCQTFQDWELILIDDGSTVDEIFLLLNKIEDPRVKVIRDRNNFGLAYRLNQIIDLAQGKYIARMDADDLMHPDRLEKQINFLENHPEVDVVDTGAYVLNKDGVPVGLRGLDDKWKPDAVKALKHGIVLHPSVVARRDWYCKNKYDTDYKRAQDRELFVRVFSNTNFYHICEPLYFYRYINNVRIKPFLESYHFERKVLLKYGPQLIGYIKTLGLYTRSIAKSLALPILVGMGRQDIVTRSGYCPITPEQKAEAIKIISHIKNQRVPGWDDFDMEEKC